MAQVPKHEELATIDCSRGNMSKQVNVPVPKTLAETQHSLGQGYKDGHMFIHTTVLSTLLVTYCVLRF